MVTISDEDKTRRRTFVDGDVVIMVVNDEDAADEEEDEVESELSSSFCMSD